MIQRDEKTGRTCLTRGAIPSGAHAVTQAKWKLLIRLVTRYPIFKGQELLSRDTELEWFFKCSSVAEEK